MSKKATVYRMVMDKHTRSHLAVAVIPPEINFTLIGNAATACIATIAHKNICEGNGW